MENKDRKSLAFKNLTIGKPRFGCNITMPGTFQFYILKWGFHGWSQLVSQAGEERIPVQCTLTVPR